MNDEIQQLKNAERKLFEKWADDQGFDLEFLELTDQYDTRDTQEAWIAWFARGQLAEVARATEPALYVNGDELDNAFDGRDHVKGSVVKTGWHATPLYRRP